jgi:hypothetical protein
MIKIVLAFVILAVIIHFGIMSWQKMSGTDRWSLTRTAFYSIIISLLALAAMTILVVLF